MYGKTAIAKPLTYLGNGSCLDVGWQYAGGVATQNAQVLQAVKDHAGEQGRAPVVPQLQGHPVDLGAVAGLVQDPVP